MSDGKQLLPPGVATAGSGEEARDVSTLIETMLEIEEIDDGLFRGGKLWKPMMARGAFGGHVVGQSLVACVRTVAVDKAVHSFHSYFVMAADAEVPIIYTVKRLRDGRSFATRSCVATQQGRTIFCCMASFHRLEVPKFRHQLPMPVAPPPESLPDSRTRVLRLLDDERVPDFYKDLLQKNLSKQGPIDMRYCAPSDPVEPTKTAPHNMVWLRAHGDITDLATHAMHQCVLAYASDLALLGTAMLPTGHARKDVAMMASLDHSLWFHSDFRADRWLLYEMESTRYDGNRAYTTGRVFQEDGTLVASVAQEGVIRFQEAVEAALPDPPAAIPRFWAPTADGSFAVQSKL